MEDRHRLIMEKSLMTPGCENDFYHGTKVGTTFYIGGAKRYTLIGFILILSCVVMLLGKHR